MIRIRFHGRGGHGVKTAGRILGTAAFRAGYHVQDSPIYGAERRGAPVAAFTRISEEAILERGVIEFPEIIVIADDSLIDDPAAAVLEGHEGASVVFVNANTTQRLSACGIGSAQAIALDISEQTRTALGDAHALSIGLGAVAARLTGLISVDDLVESTREETAELHMPPEIVEKNMALACSIFESVSPIAIVAHDVRGAVKIHSLAHDEPGLATPSIFKPGNSVLKNTGNWRIEEPIIDNDLCSKCKMCFVYCPDGAISLDADQYPLIDYDHCKGCMICQHVCPVHGAITAKKEVQAW